MVLAGLAKLYANTSWADQRIRYDNCREEWHGALRVNQIARPRQAGRSRVRLCLRDHVEVAEVEGWAGFMCSCFHARPKDRMRSQGYALVVMAWFKDGRQPINYHEFGHASNVRFTLL